MVATEKFSKSYLSTATFVSRAYSVIEQFSDSKFFSRKGDCKKVIEEILPTAAFLKYFERPGRQVKCRYFPGNQPYDAIIKVEGKEVQSGHIEQSYFLEVTSAIASYNHLEREALSRYGSVFGGGKIRRVGSKQKGNDRIISEAVAEDGDAPVIKASEWAIKCLKDKANKERYPEPCILLVQVEPERPLGIREWLTIVENIQGSVNREAFKATFLVNAWGNVVLQV